MSRVVWFDGREIPFERQEVWELVNNSAFETVAVTAEQRTAGRFPAKTKLVTAVSRMADLEGIDPSETVLSADRELLLAARKRGHATCLEISVDSREALERAWQDAGEHDFAVVEFDLPTNIPLELILARMTGRRTILLKKEATFEGLEVAFGVMEQGSDGALLSTADIGEILKVNRYLLRQAEGSIQLQPLKVSGARHIGMGVRACVDTTGLMGTDEGMIVGSTSSGGIFVCSETHYLPYMNLRPFRVNAGAVHSYIWMPGDAAEYLTDLRAGSKVMCVNTEGRTRPLTVGRVKAEVRPLLLVEGEAAGQPINVIVQDDWHIRIMGADGKPRNATQIRPGDELLSYVCKPGRHVGISVEETIIER